MSDCLIRTQNLSRDFRTVRAVDNLTMEIPRGIVFGFLGPNGSGKTTTIRLLLGLLAPSAGSAQVFGYDTRSQSAAIRERTGALLEHTGLYERLTAEDNLDFYGRIAHLSRPQRRARAQELLEHFGLWERRKEVVGNWSRGMKQKLAIARAMIHRPELIFLDEPTAGLDPLAAVALREDLANLASDHKTTIFLTTHNLTDAEKLCEQVAVIRSGRLLAVGRPDELHAHRGTRQVEIQGEGIDGSMLQTLRARPEVARVEEKNGGWLLEIRSEARMAPIVTQMVLGGAQLEQVRESRTSLEEIFMDLIVDEQ